MRRTLAGFLVFMMFVSTVMCGCGHEARAESGAISYSHHDEGADHHRGKGPTLAQDCQGADMQLPAHTGVSKPDLKNSFYLVLAFADENPVWPLGLTSNRTIRGPPPWDGTSFTKPSILLTTQRLRI